MILTNPHTGKPVDVADAHVDRLLAAGFKRVEKKQEPEPEQAERPRRGRPRKSE